MIVNYNYQFKLILLVASLVICLLILSAYSNTLYAPFVLDDLHSFVKEPKVLGFTFNFVGIRDLLTTTFGVRRFLPMLTFALDLKWGGGSLAAFHVTNIVIHILVTLSLLFLLQSLFQFPKLKLFSSQNRTNKNQSALLAVFVIGLWSLNPIQTNAVTYIVQRMTSIATLFYFLAFACYLKGRFSHLTQGFSKKSLFFYLLSLVCFFCAMMSKEIAATLPAMIFLFEWLFIEDSVIFDVLKRFRIFILGFVLLILIVIGYKFYHGWLIGGYSGRHFTLSERLLTQLRVVTSYCGILLLPLPQWLNLEHDVSLSTSLFSPLTTFFSLIFIVTIIWVAWIIKEKKPLITFAVFWFFINLLIESTIVPLELKFEHRLYMPSVGFYLALVLLVRELYIYFYGNNFTIDRVKILVSAALIVCSALSFLTYTRNIAWGDTVSLYKDCVTKAPFKARTHSNLATAWLEVGEYEKGLGEAEKALALGVKGYEEYWVASCDIVASLSKMGKYREAVERGETLLKKSPGGAKKNSYPLFLYDLGQAYIGVKEFQPAFDYFLKGYEISYRNGIPLKLEFEIALAGTLKVGLLQNYIFDSEMGLDKDNSNIAVEEKMAKIFFELNDYELALKYADMILTQDKESLFAGKMKKKIEHIYVSNKAQKKLGTLKEKYFYQPFASRFNFYMALSFALERYNIYADKLLRYSLQQAEIEDDSSPDLYILKSWYFYKKKDYVRALKTVDQGIKLMPDYAHLWVNRGIYGMAVNSSEAYEDFHKALTLYPDYPHRNKIITMKRLAEKMR